MATNDDDILTGPVPDPDAEPTAAERAHAKSFAELLDRTMAGKSAPVASADDRALLEVATVIRAASGGLELPATKRRSLVEAVLRQAVGTQGAAGQSMSGVTPIDRGRRRRILPWAIAAASTAVAVAAILLLWLRPAPKGETIVHTPMAWRSRSADALIGPIPRERAGDAASRIDDIFADRLDGYRERRLERARPSGGKR